MTYRCSACDCNWWPYMTAGTGACPECGGGTKRSNEPGSLDADARYKAAQAAKAEAEQKAKSYARFEAYYFAREMHLNGLDTLPVADVGSGRRGRRKAA